LSSETETAKAQTSLRSTLHILRSVLHGQGITGVGIDRTYAELDHDEFATDLDEPVASIERGDCADRVMLGRLGSEAMQKANMGALSTPPPPLAAYG
jgi:hypothetical protein